MVRTWGPLAAAAVWGLPALASDGGSHQPPVSGDVVCYARTYAAVHLAQHPRQTVTDISLRISFIQDATEAHFPFRLSVHVRGRTDTFRAAGDCAFQDPDSMEMSGADFPVLTPTERVVCTAEGAGSVVLQPGPKGATGLLTFGKEGHIGLSGTCVTAACGLDLLPGSDDKSFLLDRTAGCAAARK